MQSQPPIAHSLQHQQLQQQNQKHQQLQQQNLEIKNAQTQHQQLPNKIPPAAKDKPLFTASQVALLRMSRRIDDLTQSTQSLINMHQNQNYSTKEVINHFLKIAKKALKR